MYPVNTNKLTVTSKFGQRTYTYQGKQISDYHKGIDLIGGSEIVAFADGEVTATCNSGVQYGQACYVRIKHSNGWQTLYYHLKSGSVCVSVGQKVSKGQKLGIMGATGQATGVHLHFQIDKGSSASAIDPYDYIFNGKELVPEVKPTPSTGTFKIGDRVIISGDLYVSSNADNPSGHVSNKETTITRIATGAKHPYNTSGDLGWMNESHIKLASGSSTPANKYYTVVRGDTLWGIAKRFYGNGNRYPEIARANNISNPDIIRVGQSLLIP